MADQPRPMSTGRRALAWTLAAFALVVIVNLAKIVLAPAPAPESAVATPTNSAVAVSLPGKPA
jgi:hypothetical protein